jgi:deazaflavin-dependent oxidoreductase (nitroreductase family)
MLFGQEHVERYIETDGVEGHEWQPGVFTLLLTTTRRRSGDPYTTPLIYVRDGGDYVIVASKGGADDHPDWYRNLEVDPEVTIRVGAEVLEGVATTIDDERRARVWPRLTEVWPDFDDYAASTDRRIPVVAITPR